MDEGAWWAAVPGVAKNWTRLSDFTFTFIGIEMKTDLSQFCATDEFSRFAGILSAALSQCYLLGFEIGQLEFHHLH